MVSKFPLFITFFFVLSAGKGIAQQKATWEEKFENNFFLSSGGYFGIQTVKISLVGDVNSDGGGTIRDGYEITEYPIYKKVDTLGILLNITGLFSASLPLIYPHENLVIGLELSVGIGILANLQAAEGLEGLLFDLSQFIYLRNKNYNGTKEGIGAGLLIGYRYTFAPLKYKFPIFGLEIAFNQGFTILRLEGSILSDKYYSYYTDGRFEPALTIREFGISYIVIF